MPHVDVCVLGAGPVGLMTALAAARSSTVVLVARPGDFSIENSSRCIESVPAPLLGLLIEFGVHPHELGVTHLCSTREIAWEASVPTEVRCPPSAHIERPSLEAALLQKIKGTRRVLVAVSPRPSVTRFGSAWRGDGWTAQHLIDATGRRAITARYVQKPPQPLVARLWSFLAMDDEVFKLAALPDGYAYRLGSRHLAMVSIVGPRGQTLRAFTDAIEMLKRHHSDWLVDRLPCSTAHRERSRVASVQWSVDAESVEAHNVRVGDAATAKDALSSQGLATGLSEALYAAATVARGGAELLALRQQEQRSKHVRSLHELIERCAWRNSPLWKSYRSWLLDQDQSEREILVALRDGRLRRLSRAGLGDEPRRA